MKINKKRQGGKTRKNSIWRKEKYKEKDKKEKTYRYKMII